MRIEFDFINEDMYYISSSAPGISHELKLFLYKGQIMLERNTVYSITGLVIIGWLVFVSFLVGNGVAAESVPADIVCGSLTFHPPLATGGLWKVSYDPQKVETRGNQSYIPIHLPGGYHFPVAMVGDTGYGVPTYTEWVSHPWIPLDLRVQFEAEHPELEVIGSRVEASHPSKHFHGCLYGLWIEHRPKLK